jgi:hypothetical protein
VVTILIAGRVLRLPKSPATEAVALQVNETGDFVCQLCVRQMRDHRGNLGSRQSAIRSRCSFNATALLCAVSFAPNRIVIFCFLDLWASFLASSQCSFNSAAYFFLNCSHLRGSCLNHLRKPVLGAIRFNHSSIPASLFFSPRGQIRSTNTRWPSDFAGSSYTRLIFTLTLSYRIKSLSRVCPVDRA